MNPATFSVVEADIDGLREALERHTVTSVELVARYLNRIAAYDRSGPVLNSVPVLDPTAFEQARESDERRASGRVLGPLDGIPFTAKDSYMVRGLSVAAGSPAFAELIASTDAFAVDRLRNAGAVFLGLTNMPPMAAGGMQRGLYGRAESPYNLDYLTAAFGSGSSNGSGTATAASFAAFGLGEETWSSGRAPASNNALVAYTPSRGMISARGNWPLVPTMDVVVPHTRSVADLKRVLDVVVVDDADTSGDLWRQQPWVPLPRPSEVRPASFSELDDLPLAGLRLAVPRIYINADPESAAPIDTRPSVMELWAGLRTDLEAAGATVVETDFPAVENYERLHADSRTFVDRGLVAESFLETEVGDLAAASFDDFLRRNGDPALHRLADVDPTLIFPDPDGALPDSYGTYDFDVSYDLGEYVERAADGLPAVVDVEGLEAGLRGLERTREVDFEQWLADGGFDAVIFPAAADVGPADADVVDASAEVAWRNGVWVSNGNLVPRHLGIPTVTVPMGIMPDIMMPVGLTIAGPAYDDPRLVALASAISALGARRVAPPLTPPLADEAPFERARPAALGDLAVHIDSVTGTETADGLAVSFAATVTQGRADEYAAFIGGSRVAVEADGNRVSGSATVPAEPHRRPHSVWRAPYGPLIVVVVRDADGAVVGAVGSTAESPF
jgi:amidase